MAEQFRLEQIRKEQEEEREVGDDFKESYSKARFIFTAFDTEAVNISYNFFPLSPDPFQHGRPNLSLKELFLL